MLLCHWKTFHTAVAWYKNDTGGTGTLQIVLGTFANAVLSRECYQGYHWRKIAGLGQM